MLDPTRLRDRIRRRSSEGQPHAGPTGGSGGLCWSTGRLRWPGPVRSSKDTTGNLHSEFEQMDECIYKKRYIIGTINRIWILRLKSIEMYLSRCC